MSGPAGMRSTGTGSAIERPRRIPGTGTVGTRRLPVAVREREVEPGGEGRRRGRNTDRLTGVTAGRVSVFFHGCIRRGFTEVGDGMKSSAEARHRSAYP